jgi:aminobenzoyl-glutamate utilization protein B
MTETTVESKVVSAVSNLLGNTPLEDAMQRSFERLGAPLFDDTDLRFAAQIQSTLCAEDIAAAYARVGVAQMANQPLCDFVVPKATKGQSMIGSTDLGDVSWIVPTVQARVATHAIGTPGHSWQFTAQGKSDAAHKGMVHAAKVMASTAANLLSDTTLIAHAKADHRARLASMPYDCPLPKDVQPPLQPRPRAP